MLVKLPSISLVIEPNCFPIEGLNMGSPYTRSEPCLNLLRLWDKCSCTWPEFKHTMTDCSPPALSLSLSLSLSVRLPSRIVSVVRPTYFLVGPLTFKMHSSSPSLRTNGREESRWGSVRRGIIWSETPYQEILGRSGRKSQKCSV